MKKLLTLLLLIALFASCVTSKQSSNTTDSSETIINTRIVHDTITVEKIVTVQDDDLLNKINTQKDSLDKQQAVIDSILLSKAMQDQRILEMARQLANKTFSIAPITVDETYATGTAGITNNKLWLTLRQKQIVAEIPVSDTTKISSSTDTSKETITKNRSTI
jgi:uncharacterized protein YcfL